MCKYWSVNVVAKYKNQYENNSQYPFYTVPVNFISSMIMIIHQYIYTYMRVTLINTTLWQGKEYRDVNMPCTQKWAIIVECHHIMNMHETFWKLTIAIPMLFACF